MIQLQAFLLTLLIEVPCAVFFARVLGIENLRRIAILALLASSLTHPIVWHLNTTWTALAPWLRLLALEAGAVVIESAFYLGATALLRAVALGFVTNCASFVFGLLLYAAR